MTWINKFLQSDMANGHGGARPGGGRKPKATEIELIERLSPLDDVALDALKTGVKNGDYNFVKLFMEYRFGKPKQDIGLSGALDLATKIVFK